LNLLVSPVEFPAELLFPLAEILADAAEVLDVALASGLLLAQLFRAGLEFGPLFVKGRQPLVHLSLLHFETLGPVLELLGAVDQVILPGFEFGGLRGDTPFAFPQFGRPAAEVFLLGAELRLARFDLPQYGLLLLVERLAVALEGILQLPYLLAVGLEFRLQLIHGRPLLPQAALIGGQLHLFLPEPGREALLVGIMPARVDVVPRLGRSGLLRVEFRHGRFPSFRLPVCPSSARRHV
jgi:hypothetical protein